MYICNCCKKIFPDVQDAGMKINYRFKYGSAHDGDIFDMTICDDCADKIAEGVEPMCQISPFITFEDEDEPYESEGALDGMYS